MDYARSGNEATSDVTIDAGNVPPCEHYNQGHLTMAIPQNLITDIYLLFCYHFSGPLEQFQHSMEPQLRQLGLNTTLKKGKIP